MVDGPVRDEESGGEPSPGETAAVVDGDESPRKGYDGLPSSPAVPSTCGGWYFLK